MGWTSIGSFALGLLSGLVVTKVNEWLRAQRALSEKVFTPIHEQLTELTSYIKRHLPLNQKFVWSQVLASGLAPKLDRKTREMVADLYQRTLPHYSQDLTDASRQWEQFGNGWDTKFGGRFLTSCKLIHFNWWPFLLDEQFTLPIAALSANECMPIHMQFIDHDRLTALGLTSGDFCRDRWQEATSDPIFVKYRATRRKALTEIETALTRLATLITP